MPEFEVSDNKEYKMEVIRNSIVYAKKVDGYLSELYYLVAWKGYPDEKNTWEPSSAVMQLRKIVSIFIKYHPIKSIITLAPLDSAPSIAKPII